MSAKSRSAKYYANHPDARRKKAAYDTRLNNRPEQVNKREESNKMRARAKKRGAKVRGFDWDHAVRHLVKSSINRGRTSGTIGDRNARGRMRFGRRAA